MNPSTATDALLADLLGDLVKIREQVDGLPQAISNANADARQLAERIERATEQLTQAGNFHQKVVSDYVENVAGPKVAKAAKDAAKSERLAIREDMTQACTQLQQFVDQVTAESRRVQRLNTWLIACSGLAVLVVCGAIAAFLFTAP